MAGHMTLVGGSPCFIDYADAYGEAVVNGRVWRWEYHNYLGPTFLRKDGEPRKCQCPTIDAVWDAFQVWLKKYEKARNLSLRQRASGWH